MDNPLVSHADTVAETLRKVPGAARVLVAHRTACVGCSLARFCTLDDVARTYELELQPFLAKLQQAAQAEPLHSTGAHYEASD